MIRFDPYDHELDEDPYPVYREMRARAPVYHNPDVGFWALARFEDVMRGLEQPHLYSSAAGISLQQGSGEADLPLPMMIVMDPPRHDQLRGLVNKAFTPRRIAALEPRIRKIAAELLDAFLEQGRCEFFRDFSGPLPTTVIAELLGVPPEDREMFKRNSTAVVAGGGRIRSSTAHDPMRELAVYMATEFEKRRRQPREDLMSELLQAEIGGERLTQNELLGFAILLLIAGNETTTNLINNAIWQLDRHRDQLALLLEDPGRCRVAVEEFLRFDSPVQGVVRTLSADAEVRGHKLPKGEKVFLLLASANRDERRFADSERFDVTRQPNRHVAFGYSTHFCLGSSLARLEARVAFEELLSRVADLRIAGPTPRLHTETIRGLSAVPLEFQRRH